MGISHRNARLAALAAQGQFLALASLLYFVDLFLPWSRTCRFWQIPYNHVPEPFSPLLPHATASLCMAQGNGWGGAGTVAGVLAGVLFLWEAARVARVGAVMPLGYRSLLSAALAFGVLLFTVIQVVALLTWMQLPTGSLLFGGLFAWIALALAIVIGLCGLVHWRLWEEHAPRPGTSGGLPPTGETVTIPPDAPPPAPAGACPACGRLNPEDAQFCSACGRSLPDLTPRRRPSRRTPPTS